MLNWLVWMSFSATPLAFSESRRRVMAACTFELASPTVITLAETPMPSRATSGSMETRPSPLTLMPCGPELSDVSVAPACARGASDDGGEPDDPGDADDSESQAANRMAAKSAPTTRRSPMPFFTSITSSAPGIASNARPTTGLP